MYRATFSTVLSRAWEGRRKRVGEEGEMRSREGGKGDYVVFSAMRTEEYISVTTQAITTEA